MRSPFWVLATTVAAGFTTGCDDVVFNGREPSVNSCLRSPPLGWENFGEGHMDKHCNGCHSSLLDRVELRNGAPLGSDFDTYDGVLLWADRIHTRGVVQVSMPPGGGPSAQELTLFEEWLLCEVFPDAAEITNDTDPPPEETE